MTVAVYMKEDEHMKFDEREPRNYARVKKQRLLITGPGHVLKLSPECRKYASGPSPVYDSRQQRICYISPS